jgi:hypothetical protein
MNEKGKTMSTKTEGTFAIIAAFIVLLSAMWNPLISAVVSIVLLLAFGIYKWVQKSG